MYNEFVLKYKKHIILIIIFLTIFILIYGLSNTQNSKRKKVIKAITYNGFTVDSGALYEKDIDDKTYEEYKNKVENNESSTYKHLYFDPYSYQLIENYFEYDNEIEASLTATYDYRYDNLVYTYNVKHSELDLTFSGKLTSKGFTCKTDYAFNAGLSNKEDFCFEIEKIVRDFEKTKNDVITSTKILNYMKQK